MGKSQEAIAGLVEAIAAPLDRDDLGRLARMHTWCQELVEAGLDGGPPAADGAVRALAGSLLVLLERLILDEAADAQRGMALVPEAVGMLAQLERGAAVDPGALLTDLDAAAGAGGAAAGQAERAAAAAAASAGVPAGAGRGGPACPAPAAGPEAGAAPAAAGEAGAAGAAGPAAGAGPYVSEPLVLDPGEREHLLGFLEEAAEHMDAIEAALLEVEADPADTNKINELFRPFHTIKGIAGFLNLRDINRLTHEIETILDQGRKGALRITAGTVDLILAGVDALAAQLAAIRQYLAAPSGGVCPQPDITALMGRLQAAARGARAGAEPAGRPRLGELLVAEGAAPGSDVDAALDVQARGGAPRKLGEILVEAGVTSPDRVERALTRQARGAVLGDRSIRVDTGKLDALVDAVGELVIAQSMVSLCETIRTDDKLQRNVAQVSKIVRDVQETAMAMRMVPIGQTFQKMRRLARDVARKAGKLVELTIDGEDTELDKNVIQQISDPLIHMVRNAIDHGIEAPEVRRRLGKSETGRVHLNAYHQGDSIVIEVHDDGQGLDPQKLMAKARERGLLGADETLSDAQAFALVLQPGFSTAAAVTEISGRGVGLDVVRRNVEQLRGKIDIQSQAGRGSVFRIRLPLTLAIIDGMIVRAGSERLIVPTILIEQSLRPEARQITTVQGRGQMIQVRGELCPLIQLGELFGYGPRIDPCANLVVIVQCEGRKLALVVEELIGQQQVVIKSLGARFKGLRGVSGAAILGDGRVGLILEPGGLLALHSTCGGGAAPVRTGPGAAATRGPTSEAEPNPSGAACPAEPVSAPV